MPTATKKPPRIALRISPEKRELLERAAALETGGDLSKFVLGSAEERAAHVLEQHEFTVMSEQTRARLYEILEHPPAPTAHLARLMREGSENFRIVD